MERPYSFWRPCRPVSQTISVKIFRTIAVCSLLVPLGVTSQQQQSSQGADYAYRDNDDYQYKNVGGNSYSNNQEVDYGDSVVDDEPHMCYSCEYSLLEDGHIEGYDNCNEPFDPTNIPEIQCTHACSKKFEIQGPLQYTVRRMCTPNCRDRSVKSGGYTKCCYTNLCNGSRRFHSLRDSFFVVVAFSGALLAILTFAWP